MKYLVPLIMVLVVVIIMDHNTTLFKSEAYQKAVRLQSVQSDFPANAHIITDHGNNWYTIEFEQKKYLYRHSGHTAVMSRAD